MNSSSKRLIFAAVLALLLAFLLPAATRAAVPNKDAVPAYPEEQTIQQAEQRTPEPSFDSAASGRVHMDRHYLGAYGDYERNVILQRGGNTWRILRNGPIALVSGMLLLVVPLLIFGFYLLIGPASRVAPSPTGQRIQRFDVWQRTIHWVTAISFLALAATGLILMFGKVVMLPWMGHDVFSWFAIIGKYVHNFIGPLFVACSILMFATFMRENFFRRVDWQWIKQGGGLISHKHVPAGYFNAGEKVWFWGGVTVLGLVMSVTGLVLDFVTFGQTRYLLQLADYLHIGGATLYIVGAMGHIYIGTLGTPGAYEAMREGSVDAEWAKAHHRLWYDDFKSGKQPDGARPAVVPPGAQPGTEH